MSERKWFYMNNQQKEGPIAESNLRQMVSKEILPPTVLIWSEGMPGWEPASALLFVDQPASGAVPNQLEWFYEFNDKKQGPVPEAELRALMQSGNLSSKNLVWCEKFTDWKPIEAVPEFDDVRVPEGAPSMKSRPSRPATTANPQATGSPLDSGNAKKSGTPIVPILVFSVILLLLVGAGIAAALFYGKSLIAGANIPITQSTPSNQNAPAAQTGQGDQSAAGSPDGALQSNIPADGTSIAVTPPPSPDSNNTPIGLPPPPYVEEVSKAMLAKLNSTNELNQIDCTNIPAKDPDYEQNLGIINGTTENRSGKTIWKCQMGGDDELYMVFDNTFSRMYAYELNGETEMVADLVPSSQSSSFPKEMYMYEYPNGDLEKFGVLARPDILYAFTESGRSNGYFSGTEFLSPDGKREGSITVFPSK